MDDNILSLQKHHWSMQGMIAELAKKTEKYIYNEDKLVCFSFVNLKNKCTGYKMKIKYVSQPCIWLTTVGAQARELGLKGNGPAR